MLVNVVDVPPLCNFILPAIVRTGPLAIAISTAGASPALAKRMKREIAEQFGEEYARAGDHAQRRARLGEGHAADLPGPQGVLRVHRQRRARPDRAAARRRRRRPCSTSSPPRSPRAGAGVSRRLTHLDEHGDARMVDVGGKPVDRRGARSRGPSCACRRRPPRAVAAGDAPKGDVLGTARIAGIHGRQAHRRADPALPPARPRSRRRRRRRSTPRPGPSRSPPRRASRRAPASRWRRMTAASVAALTVYDMVKGVERGVAIAVGRAAREVRRAPAARGGG